ncbi:MAG TPA: alpha/beta hydrolase [Friedmanniella sp.]
MEHGSDEVRFSAPGGPVLAGTLTLPPSRPLRSAVLMIGGSGPTERTNDGFFDPVRAELLGRGAAVLTYDKRGAGLSAGTWSTADVHDLAADAAAGLALLRARTDVRLDRVVVFGHSEGAWVALRLGVLCPDLGRLVLSSGPSVPFLDAEVHALRTGGMPASRAARAGDHLAELARLAAAGLDADVGREQTDAVRREDWFAELEAAGFRLDDVAWAQLRAWGGYDPHPDLLALGVSTLSLFGSDDPLVPVAGSIAVNEGTAVLAGRTHVNEVVPGVGHRMSAAPGQDPSLRFLACVGDWCSFAG